MPTDCLLVLGEALMDIVVKDGTTVQHPGGSPMNVSLGLARLGCSVTFATALGNDDAGRAILEHLEASGVDVVPGLESGRTTSSARVTLDDAGTPEYLFDVDWSPELDGHLPADPVHVHTGSIGAFLPPGAETLAHIVRSARPTATISFDPNIRPQFLPDHAAAVAAVERHVRQSDIVKASDEDVAWLYPGIAIEDVAAAWLELGPPVVIVTRGAEGAVAVTRRGIRSVPGHRVAVVDSIGAGDSFMSGLIAGMNDKGLVGAAGRAGLADISDETVSELLALAMACAAVTVSRAGAQPPRRDELPPTVLER